MNARVTNLEKQIEEMQKQIKQADEKIAETDLQKQKLRTKVKFEDFLFNSYCLYI